MADPKTVRRSELIEVDGERIDVRQFTALKFYRLLDRYGAFQSGRIGLADLYVPTVADALDRSDETPPGPVVLINEVGKKSRELVAKVYAAVLRVNDFEGYLATLDDSKKKP